MTFSDSLGNFKSFTCLSSRKYPYLPHGKEFFLLGIPIKFHTFLFFFSVFLDPLLPRGRGGGRGGLYGDLLELHNQW